MSNLGELSINAKITVSEDTATRCCQLLNIFAEDHPNIEVETMQMLKQDGSHFKGVVLTRHFVSEEK